jgi:hypothetical protein
MKRRIFFSTAALGLVGAAYGFQQSRSKNAPELVGDEKAWVNGKPLTLAAQKGKVVVVTFWTFQ